MNYYDSSYDPNLAYNSAQTAASADPGLSLLAIVIIFFFVFLFWVGAYAIIAFFLSRIFKKAGVPQWAAWVPVYNGWKVLEIGGQPGFWSIISFIPFVGLVSLVFFYIAMHKIGKKLGKEDWFILLAIFLPVVWMIWLGFDDSTWEKDKKVAAAPKKAAAKTTKAAAAAKPAKKAPKKKAS